MSGSDFGSKLGSVTGVEERRRREKRKSKRRMVLGERRRRMRMNTRREERFPYREHVGVLLHVGAEQAGLEVLALAEDHGGRTGLQHPALLNGALKVGQRLGLAEGERRRQ